MKQGIKNRSFLYLTIITPNPLKQGLKPTISSLVSAGLTIITPNPLKQGLKLCECGAKFQTVQAIITPNPLKQGLKADSIQSSKLKNAQLLPQIH